jgi:hypothetical protein
VTGARLTGSDLRDFALTLSARVWKNRFSLSLLSSRIGGDASELSSTYGDVVPAVIAFGAVVEAMMRLSNGAACKDLFDAQGVFAATRICQILDVFE